MAVGLTTLPQNNLLDNRECCCTTVCCPPRISAAADNICLCTQSPIQALSRVNPPQLQRSDEIERIFGNLLVGNKNFENLNKMQPGIQTFAADSREIIPVLQKCGQLSAECREVSVFAMARHGPMLMLFSLEWMSVLPSSLQPHGRRLHASFLCCGLF